MRSSRTSFFSLFNAVYRGESGINVEKSADRRNILDADENEWMQEYYIIYNSYILDSQEPDNLNV